MGNNPPNKIKRIHCKLCNRIMRDTLVAKTRHVFKYHPEVCIRNLMSKSHDELFALGVALARSMKTNGIKKTFGSENIR